MKAPLKKFGDEGNNILNASDMRTALKERQVSGTTASVCRINEATSSLDIKGLIATAIRVFIASRNNL